MESHAFGRVVHILGVVLWIGGVALETTVLLPAIKPLKSAEEQISTFEMNEVRRVGRGKRQMCVGDRFSRNPVRNKPDQIGRYSFQPGSC